jgi:plastocyanin
MRRWNETGARNVFHDERTDTRSTLLSSGLRMRIIRLLASAVAAFAAACSSSTYAGSSNNPGGGPPMTAMVNATSLNTFTPENVAVGVGGTVTFTFGDVAHNVFFDNDPAGAPAPITGANTNMSQARTFTTAGTFEFDCHIHPGMKGTVIVSNTSSAPPAGGGLGY